MEQKEQQRMPFVPDFSPYVFVTVLNLQVVVAPHTFPLIDYFQDS
jgi:hypothetical protein